MRWLQTFDWCFHRYQREKTHSNCSHVYQIYLNWTKAFKHLNVCTHWSGNLLIVSFFFIIAIRESLRYKDQMPMGQSLANDAVTKAISTWIHKNLRDMFVNHFLMERRPQISRNSKQQKRGKIIKQQQKQVKA